MKVLSLFSGVGGFDLGLENAGFETVAMCEWDKKAASVLRRHWPHIPIYGDVSDLTGAQLVADGVMPDLVAFGSPCQDLSVAGKRAGLAGERSGLFHEAVRIIRELRELSDGTLPRWVIWENVVGALNSNGGADFRAVIEEMGELGAHLVEWAVLDSQNYGVAQRRRRVFLVACLDPSTARGCPDPLLPLRQGRPRDLVALRQAWKNSPRTSSESARGAGIVGEFTRRDGFREFGDVANTLQAFMGTGGGNVPVVMRQREGKPGGGKGPLLSEDSLTLATRNDQYLFQPVPFVKARRAKSVEDHETWVEGEVSPTLNLFDNGGEARATVLIPYTDIVGTLTVSGLEKGQTNGSTADTGVLQVYGISGMVIGRKDENGPNGISVTEEGGPMFTLTTIDRHAVATPYAVRRLLPIECERLMGWPDDWTRWDAEGKEQTDGHRYKQSGNGVASPVAEWVGRQIFAADAMSKL
jgi:DNA (cytosine-5)-methyltransferase 1